MRLLILNYSMSSSSLVFSHQLETVNQLINEFTHTTVVTAEATTEQDFDNLKVISTNWVEGRRIKSALRFLRTVVPIVIKNRDLVVFSHMTDVQSFLIAPLCWLLRMKHILWYAHMSRSPFLYLSYPFLTRVLTSTTGSCPIKGHKVLDIGQSVDANIFASESTPSFPPLRWYYVGRIDPSKRVEHVINAIMRVRRMGWHIQLDIFGTASSQETKPYESDLHEKFRQQIAEGWLKFKGPIAREEIREMALQRDGFVNAFVGSLDKTIVEAVLSRRLIATNNPEYLKSFQSPDKTFLKNSTLLSDQIIFLMNLKPTEARELLDYNYYLALNNHSSTVWHTRLVKVLRHA